LLYSACLPCYATERLHGAIVSAGGELLYVCPAFEQQKTRADLVVEGDFVLREEHEDPTWAVAKAALKC
jgi:Xaa-Pro dipeptidase